MVEWGRAKSTTGTKFLKEMAKKSITRCVLLADAISEIDCLLVNDQLLECESHEEGSRKEKVDRGESREEFVPLAPLSILFSIRKANWGDRTAFKLFLRWIKADALQLSSST